MDGVTGAIAQGFTDLGFDGVFAVVPRQPRTPEERLLFSQSPGLRASDLDVLRRRGREISGVSGRAESRVIVAANDEAVPCRVIGVEPDYRWMRNREPAEGRFFSEGDLLAGTRVCVIGSRLRRRLFGKGDAVGRDITVGDVRFRVVGVGRKLGNTWIRDGDLTEEMEGVVAPLRTVLRDFRGGGAMDMVEVKARDVGNLDAAVAEARRILVAQHGVADVRIENVAGEILRARDEGGRQVSNWRIVMLSIAGVTLIVGGVGLLSVLLISLAERTYEIGLRKALGAKGSDIFALFLVESLLLAAIGAALGIVLGVVVTHVAGRGFPDGLPVSVSGVFLALAAAMIVGLLFGLGPALRASAMPPVACLSERS
jgi:putative ABC transport system permease protein